MMRMTLTVTAVMFMLFGFFSKDAMAQSDEEIIRKFYTTTITKKEIDIFSKWPEIMKQAQYLDSEDEVNKFMKKKYGVEFIDFYAIVFRISVIMEVTEYYEDSDDDAIVALKDEFGIEVSPKEIKLIRENYDQILAVFETQLAN